MPENNNKPVGYPITRPAPSVGALISDYVYAKSTVARLEKELVEAQTVLDRAEISLAREIVGRERHPAASDATYWSIDGRRVLSQPTESAWDMPLRSPPDTTEVPPDLNPEEQEVAYGSS